MLPYLPDSLLRYHVFVFLRSSDLGRLCGCSRRCGGLVQQNAISFEVLPFPHPCYLLRKLVNLQNLLVGKGTKRMHAEVNRVLGRTKKLQLKLLTGLVLDADGIPHLAEHSHLRHLQCSVSLQDCPNAEKFWQTISHLTNLETLSLNCPTVTLTASSASSVIRRLTKLRHLEIRCLSVSDAFKKAFSHLVLLESLSLQSFLEREVTPYDHQPLTRTQLTSLELVDSGHLIVDAPCTGLCALHNLRVLSLCNFSLLEEDFNELASINTLQDISFTSCRIFLEWLGALAYLPNLARLYVKYANKSRDESTFSDFLESTSFPSLVHLCLSCCPVSDADIEALSRLSCPLTHLNLHFTDIGDNGISYLLHSPLHEHLQSLDVSYTTVTSRSLGYFSRMSRLVEVTLRQTSILEFHIRRWLRLQPQEHALDCPLRQEKILPTYFSGRQKFVRLHKCESCYCINSTC